MAGLIAGADIMFGGRTPHPYHTRPGMVSQSNDGNPHGTPRAGTGQERSPRYPGAGGTGSRIVVPVRLPAGTVFYPRPATSGHVLPVQIARLASPDIIRLQSCGSGCCSSRWFCSRSSGSGTYLVMVTTCPARDSRRRSAEADEPGIGQVSPLIADIYLRNMGKCPRSRADRPGIGRCDHVMRARAEVRPRLSVTDGRALIRRMPVFVLADRAWRVCRDAPIPR
jgi:hypothetical protein